MKVNVQPLVGAVCMTYEDGAKLHNAYRAAFDRGEEVVLDFADTRIFVSRFFNAAVGQLLKDHGIDEVRQRLKFENLPGAAIAPLRHSVENAQRYFHEPKFQAALDRVLEDQAAEA